MLPEGWIKRADCEFSFKRKFLDFLTSTKFRRNEKKKRKRKRKEENCWINGGNRITQAWKLLLNYSEGEQKMARSKDREKRKWRIECPRPRNSYISIDELWKRIGYWEFCKYLFDCWMIFVVLNGNNLKSYVIKSFPI